MLMDHIRAWLLGRPTPPSRPREQRDAQRAAASCGPKPVVEAVGDALAAVGELVSSIRASAKAAKKHHRASTSRKRVRPSRSRRGVVIVEAVRVEPRAPSAGKTRSSTRTTRGRARTIDVPIIVAPATRAASGAGDASERA
jgi:hypothetical protein